MASSTSSTTLMVPNARPPSPKSVDRNLARTPLGLLILAPPRQNPRPAWAAEEGADCGKHGEFDQEPRHDPEGEWLGHEPSPEFFFFRPVGESRPQRSEGRRVRRER